MRRIQSLRVLNNRYRSTSARAALAQRKPRDNNAQHARSSRTVLQPQAQPTVASDDGARTLRTREHGNRSLPLPPLMDPMAVAAKERYKQPKQDPSEQDSMTELQKELQFNFYARALADPVRYCSITKTRLPTHFLLPFKATLAEPTASIKSTSDEKRDAKSQFTFVPSLAPANETHNNAPAPTSYVLNSHSMVESLATKKTWPLLVSPRMKEKYSASVGNKRKKQQSWVWNDQMPDRVLDDLRQHAVRAVSYGLQRKRIVPIENLHEYSRYHPAAILETGNAVKPFKDPKMTEESTINTYRMIDIFGENDASKLIEEGTISDSTSHLAVLRHHRNFKLLFALDKLQLYVRPRDLPTTAQSR